MRDMLAGVARLEKRVLQLERKSAAGKQAADDEPITPLQQQFELDLPGGVVISVNNSTQLKSGEQLRDMLEDACISPVFIIGHESHSAAVQASNEKTRCATRVPCSATRRRASCVCLPNSPARRRP